MIEEALVKNLFTSRIQHSKKIRVDDKVIKSNIDQLVDFINLFNSMEECQDRVLNTNLSNIKVMKEIIPFIYPDSVRLDPNDRKTADILLRPTDEEKKSVPVNLDVNDFHDIQAEFRGFFRKDFGSDFETLDHIKVAKSFADVLPRMTIHNSDTWWVKYDSAPFVPVPLYNDAVVDLFRDFYFTASYAEVIQEYFTPIVF